MSETSYADGSKMEYGGASFGASFVVHLFATDSFSLSPYLQYFLHGGSGSSTDADGNTQSNVEASGSILLLGVSFSGWLGGKPAAGGTGSQGAKRSSEPEEELEPAADLLETSTSEAVGPAEVSLKSTMGGRILLRGNPQEGSEVSVVVFLTSADQSGCRDVAFAAGEHREELDRTTLRRRLRP